MRISKRIGLAAILVTAASVYFLRFAVQLNDGEPQETSVVVAPIEVPSVEEFLGKPPRANDRAGGLQLDAPNGLVTLSENAKVIGTAQFQFNGPNGPAPLDLPVVTFGDN